MCVGVAGVGLGGTSPPLGSSLYHSVVGAHGFLVPDAHGVFPATRPVLLFPQWFPADGHFHRVKTGAATKAVNLWDDLIRQADLGGLSNPS